jgi:PAS domain S-box-containing protein
MNGKGRLRGAELTKALSEMESSPSASEALRHLLRELQRHQLELEVQNRELQEAQQALEESRNRYMELYDFAPMACVSLNERACIQDLNLTGATLLRQDRGYLQGLPFTPFVDPEDVSRFLLHVRRCIAGETLRTELRLRIGGSRIEARLHGAPVTDGRQHERLCRMAIVDITELREMQVRLSLAERLATVGTMAAGVAHEINNPLAFLMGNLVLVTRQLREQPGAPTQPALQALADAQVGAERIQDVVRDLGTFARPGEEQLSHVDVRQVLELSVKMAMVELRHRAQIIRDFAEVPRIIADMARLGQVFLNLLVNAAHAIPEGASNQHQLRLTLRAEEQWVLVQIQHTGEGMLPHVLDHIFDPFFTTKEAGQGLGLAITHNLIEQMGGSISARSIPGRGSTFSIRLPVAVPSQEAPPSPPPAASLEPTERAPQGRILIVDDELRFGHTLQLLLGRAHAVTYTPSAREGLGLIQQGQRYDAILCDLMMADVTGKQFYDALCQHSPEHARRVIFMTGGAYTPASVDFVSKMTNPLLTKPFKPEALERLLLVLLPSV